MWAAFGVLAAGIFLTVSEMPGESGLPDSDTAQIGTGLIRVSFLAMVYFRYLHRWRDEPASA